MSKPLIIGTIIAVVGIFAIGGAFLWQQSQQSWPSKDVVSDPSGTGYVYVNRLTILGSGQDIEGIVNDFDGEIIFSVPETATYEVEFPVSNLNELDQIKNQLNQRKIQAIYSVVLEPPDCRRGPC